MSQKKKKKRHENHINLVPSSTLTMPASVTNKPPAKSSARPLPAEPKSTPKRKAEALLPSPPCQRLSRPPSITPPPEPLSINDIIRQHCRTRLYVPPWCWTDSHLHLLGCEFVPEEPQKTGKDCGQATTPQPARTPGRGADPRECAVWGTRRDVSASIKFSRKAVQAARDVSRGFSPDVRRLAFHHLLCSLGMKDKDE